MTENGHTPPDPARFIVNKTAAGIVIAVPEVDGTVTTLSFPGGAVLEAPLPPGRSSPVAPNGLWITADMDAQPVPPAVSPLIPQSRPPTASRPR